MEALRRIAPFRTYSITQLCREFGCTTRALRFYEEQGLLTPARRGGQRVYSYKDRTRVGLIVRGRFLDVRGTIHVPVHDDDTAAVTVEVRADSVRTGIALRDRHLRGPLFLDAARHPTITFRGGDAMRTPNYMAVPGSLTIRGVTRTEELRCSLDGLASARELSADLTVARRAYNVGVPTGLRRLDPLFVVIGDDVRISIRIPV